MRIYTTKMNHYLSRHQTMLNEIFVKALVVKMDAQNEEEANTPCKM